MTRNHHHLFDRIASTLQSMAGVAEAFHRSCCVASAAGAAAVSCRSLRGLSGSFGDWLTLLLLECNVTSRVMSFACELSCLKLTVFASELVRLLV